MSFDDLVHMFRHAAGNGDMQHAAALAEVGGLLNSGLDDAKFRQRTAEVLAALYQVQDELDGGAS